MRFKDRKDAGQVLAEKLLQFRDQSNGLILALPRGGVPVAYEVAHDLHLPLDIFLVRKLGFPGQPELAMGAIASGGVLFLNESLIQSKGVSSQTIEDVMVREKQELERRERVYRDGRSAQLIENRAVILIDDGLATGASMRAAIIALHRQQPAQLIIAVPVAAQQACDELQHEVDQVVCALTPKPFYGVGQWYDDFTQTSDEEVIHLLQNAALSD